MIDSIHIRLQRTELTTEQISTLLSRLIIKKTIEHSNGRISYIGNYKNFNVAVHPKTITLNGSLPTFLNGHNLKSMPHWENIKALKQLSKELGIPIMKGEIARIDVAETIPVDNNIIRYFLSLDETPKFVRYRYDNPSNGVRYEKKNVILAFYNKTHEAMKHANAYREYGSKQLLRIELRINFNVRRTLKNKIRKLAVLHLMAPLFIKRLANYWLTTYHEIVKKRRLLKYPHAKSWNTFQDYLTATALLANSYGYWYDVVNVTSLENGWDTRTKTNVTKKLKAIYTNCDYSVPNPYIAELDNKVNNTKTAMIAKGGCELNASKVG